MEGLAFAISTEALDQALGISRRELQFRAYFGVVVAESLAASAGANTDAGLTVVVLDPIGPLASAGVRVGDEILTIDGRRVQTLADRCRLVDTLIPWQDRFSVTFRRRSLFLEGHDIVYDKMTETKPVLWFMTRELYKWEAAF